MSEPARNQSESSTRPSAAPGPLRDWLAAMRAVTPEKAAELQAAEPETADERPQGWAPRLIVPPSKDQVPADAQAGAQEDGIAEIVAENLML